VSQGLEGLLPELTLSATTKCFVSCKHLLQCAFLISIEPSVKAELSFGSAQSSGKPERFD
jgi:hypothetical protein